MRCAHIHVDLNWWQLKLICQVYVRILKWGEVKAANYARIFSNGKCFSATSPQVSSRYYYDYYFKSHGKLFFSWCINFLVSNFHHCCFLCGIRVSIWIYFVDYMEKRLKHWQQFIKILIRNAEFPSCLSVQIS